MHVFSGRIEFIQAQPSKSIQEMNVDRIHNSVPGVTVWHHSVEPRDAMQ